MTEATQTPAPALPAPQAGDTKRAYLARHGLAVAVDKNGVAPRGRFSNAGVAAIDAAEAAGFVFADAPKAKRTPKVAATTVPAQAEAVEPAEAVSEVVAESLPTLPEPARAETRGFGRFFGKGSR